MQQEQLQREVDVQRSSNNSFKNDYDSLNDFQAVVNPSEQIESIIQEMQNELFPKSNIPKVIHSDQMFQQAHASDLQNKMFFEQFVGNQEKLSNQDRVQGEQRYTLGPYNPTNFENSPENHAMSVDLFSEQKYLAKEKNESYSDQQISQILKQKQITINILSQLISSQMIDSFLEPLIRKIAREAFVNEQMALMENDDEILRSSQRQIYNSNVQISQAHNQSVQQSQNTNYFTQNSNQFKQDNINLQNAQSNQRQSQIQINQQINNNYNEIQNINQIQKLAQNQQQYRQINDLKKEVNLKIQSQQFMNNRMSINNYQDDQDQEEDVNDEDDKILQVKQTQQQNIFQIQKNNDFISKNDGQRLNQNVILFHQSNQSQQSQLSKIFQNNLMDQSVQMAKLKQKTPQMQIIQDQNIYPISMTEQSSRKQNNFKQFDINNQILNMTVFKPNNIKFEENNQQVDKFFQDEDSTPFQNKEYLKMQASTERKALNVFEREKSANNENLKWFDSLKQNLMNLGSPNTEKKNQYSLSNPSQFNFLNQSNINSFNFRSLITGRGADVNNNFQIIGDQSIQLSTRGDEAIDVVCMNCGTYVQPQNVNIHSRECNQNQQQQTVSIFNKKRKQQLIIESNQKSLLKEMNDNISKVQEAIFSKLIKFDQKYETITLQIQQNSKKTYQADNSFISYKEFGHMVGDDNYFETSYNTSALNNQKQNFNVNESQFQDQNLELMKKMSHISRLTIENKGQLIQSIQEEEKAAKLIKKLEYFIDQYSNLHAVCKQTLEIDEDPMQLQIIMNVLVQDYKEMEEMAIQHSLTKQQQDSIHRSNQRQKSSSMLQSPSNRLSNSEYKHIGTNSFIDQMMQNLNGYNQTSISQKTARKQDEIMYDQKHGQLLVFSKKLVQIIKEKLQALQNFENLLQNKELAQLQQNEELDSIYQEYSNRQTIQNEIQKMQIGQISFQNKQKVLLDAERNKISQQFDLDTIHNNSEIKDSENSLQFDHLKSISVRQSFQNSIPKNFKIGQFLNSSFQKNQQSIKADRFNNMRSSVVSKSVVNIQVQQQKEVVQKNIGEIEISIDPKINVIQKSDKVDKIYQQNLLNQIKSDQSSLININSKSNDNLKDQVIELDFPITSEFQKDIGYELFTVNGKQQNQALNFENKIQTQEKFHQTKALKQSPPKKQKKGGLSDFIENYVNDENQKMNMKFEKDSDQNKTTQKINAYEDHTFQNKLKTQIVQQNEIDKSPSDGRKSFKQFQQNRRNINQTNDTSYSERVDQLQQFQDQKIDLNFLKKQSQLLKDNQLQAQKQKEININSFSVDKAFESSNQNRKQLDNFQMSKQSQNDKQSIKLDQIFKDTNDSPNDSYKSSNEKQAQQIQFSFLNQNTKSIKKPTQLNKVNENQQKSPSKSPLNKQFLEKQERTNIFDRQKMKSPENFSTLQRQKSLQNSNLLQSNDKDKAADSQMIKKSYMPINTHEKLKAENERLNKNQFESPDQKSNQNISPQKFPKKSKKIDIESYGYDNDTLQNARKSVDRLMSASKNDQGAFQIRQSEKKFQQQNQILQQLGQNIMVDKNQGQNEWNGMGQMNLATIQSVNETTEISDIEQLNIMQESEAEMLIDNYKFNEKDIDAVKLGSPPKSQRNNIFSKNRHRNCSKHSNSDNEQSESYRYTFEQRSDSVASQKKKSFLPQRTQSKEQNRKRIEQKQNVKKEEEQKQMFVSTEKPRKSRRINIEEFGYDGLTISRARNSVSSLSRQTILTNLSAQKEEKKI